jgi:hypothetical protein
MRRGGKEEGKNGNIERPNGTEVRVAIGRRHAKAWTTCGGGLIEENLKMERVMGIEPTWPVWKTGTLPLSYTRYRTAMHINV